MSFAPMACSATLTICAYCPGRYCASVFFTLQIYFTTRVGLYLKSGIWNCVVRTPLLELRCWNCVVRTMLLELRSWNCVVGTSLLELRCWNCVVGAALCNSQSKTFAAGIRTKYIRPKGIRAYICTKGGIAQLARALAWHARGHRFESDYLHLKFP